MKDKKKQTKMNKKEAEKTTSTEKKATTKKEPKKTPTKKATTKKQAPKKNSVKTETTKTTKNTTEIVKLLKTVLVVTAIMLVFYGVTIIVTDKADNVKEENKAKETAANAEIQYEEIIIGTMLNYEATYYVIIKDKDDTRLDEYESLITTIQSSDDAPVIYTANLTDGFNKKYKSKEENYYPEDISEFAVTGTTLIKISDHKIDSIYDNYDAIKNKLNDLS